MTADQFRALVLAMPGAVEGAHMGHADFRVNGRIFATLDAAEEWGMLVVDPEQQRTAINAKGSACVAANGAWGQRGCTRVRLAAARRAEVEPLVMNAWQNAMAKTAARPRKTRKRR